jgi:hypothetical protein
MRVRQEHVFGTLVIAEAEKYRLAELSISTVAGISERKHQ